LALPSVFTPCPPGEAQRCANLRERRRHLAARSVNNSLQSPATSGASATRQRSHFFVGGPWLRSEQGDVPGPSHVCPCRTPLQSPSGLAEAVRSVMWSHICSSPTPPHPVLVLLPHCPPSLLIGNSTVASWCLACHQDQQIGACGPSWPGPVFVNRLSLEPSHARLFTSNLWLCSPCNE
jgi:hypothetical protein